MMSLFLHSLCAYTPLSIYSLVIVHLWLCSRVCLCPVLFPAPTVSHGRWLPLPDLVLPEVSSYKNGVFPSHCRQRICSWGGHMIVGVFLCIIVRFYNPTIHKYFGCY